MANEREGLVGDDTSNFTFTETATRVPLDEGFTPLAIKAQIALVGSRTARSSVYGNEHLGFKVSNFEDTGG